MSARQTDRTLAMLLDNGGSFPPDDENRQEQDGRKLLDPPMDADAAMSTRYFLVFLDEEGTVVRTDVTRIASVDDEEAKRLAEEVLATGKQRERSHIFPIAWRTRRMAGDVFLYFWIRQARYDPHSWCCSFRL